MPHPLRYIAIAVLFITSASMAYTYSITHDPVCVWACGFLYGVGVSLTISTGWQVRTQMKEHENG